MNNTRPDAYEIPAYRLGLHFGRKPQKVAVATKPKEGK